MENLDYSTKIAIWAKGRLWNIPTVISLIFSD